MPRLLPALGALLVLLGSPPGRAEDCRVLEDFAGVKAGEFPPDWKVRKDAGKSVYTVREEGHRRFLAAHARGQGIQAAKAFEWDVDEYPVLAWSWRPHEFPPGANEREGENDSALAVYFMVPHSRIRGPKAVKYIWSERVPEGTRLASNGGLTQVRVLRSGTARRGQWVDERVDVRADFRAYFEEDVPTPAGIAVLTDSDDTSSSARGDYATFRVCRQ